MSVSVREAIARTVSPSQEGPSPKVKDRESTQSVDKVTTTATSVIQQAVEAAAVETGADKPKLTKEPPRTVETPTEKEEAKEAVLCQKADAKETEAPAPSKEETTKQYVEKKRAEVLSLVNTWSESFKPRLAGLLGMFPGMDAVAKSNADKMTATFKKKLGEATTILELKKALEKNIEVLESNKPLVNQATADQLDAAIVMCREQIASLPTE